MKILIDTHIWYWFVVGDKTLPNKIIETINQSALEDTLYLSAISVWEIAMLENKKRITFRLPSLQWINEALKNIPIQLIPLTPEISVESCSLVDFHGDPADRIIVATARVENLTLVTRDKDIKLYAKQNTINVMMA